MRSREISYHRCVRTSNRPGNRNRKSVLELEIPTIKVSNEAVTSPVSEASPSEAREAPSNIRGKLSKSLSRSFLFGRSKSSIGVSSPEPEDLSSELHSLRQKITRSKSFYRFPTTEAPAIRGFKHAPIAQMDASWSKSPSPMPKRDRNTSRLFSLHARFLGRHKKHVTFVLKPTIIPPSPYYLDWDHLNDIAPTFPDVLNEEILDSSSTAPEELEGLIDDPSSPTPGSLPVELELEWQGNVCNTLV